MTNTAWCNMIILIAFVFCKLRLLKKYKLSACKMCVSIMSDILRRDDRQSHSQFYCLQGCTQGVMSCGQKLFFFQSWVKLLDWKIQHKSIWKIEVVAQTVLVGNCCWWSALICQLIINQKWIEHLHEELLYMIHHALTRVSGVTRVTLSRRHIDWPVLCGDSRINV